MADAKRRGELFERPVHEPRIPSTAIGRLLLGTDPRLVNPMRRTLMGAVSYCVFLPVVAAAASFGWLRGGWSTFLFLVLLAITVSVLFASIIRAGLTRRLADPACTAAQIAVASLVVLVLLGFLRRDVGPFLALYAACFFFGVFRLEWREYLRVALFAILSFVGLFLYRLGARGYPAAALRRDGLRLLVLLSLLVWTSFVGGYVTRLRRTNERQRRALEQALARIQELLVHDELTGVYNRRHLWEILEREIQRLERRTQEGMPAELTLAIFDLDQFKALNDGHGHLVGDEILRAVANRITEEIRRQDWLAHVRTEGEEGIVVRFGGDEFILVLPDTGMAGARPCLERILTNLHTAPVMTSIGPVPITLSIGAAVWTPGESAPELLGRADQALYEAKTAGRDRLVVRGPRTLPQSDPLTGAGGEGGNGVVPLS